MLVIRPECDADVATIRAVHEAAFPTPAEAMLVDLLRKNGKARISLVSEDAGSVVGHILFSPVEIAADDGTRMIGLGLAPLAVLPEFQRRGIGSRLVLDGLAECRRQRQPFVVVLGHTEFYPRFGFERASRRGIRNEYGADEVFMVLEVHAGSLPAAGLAKYGAEFAKLGK